MQPRAEQLNLIPMCKFYEQGLTSMLYQHLQTKQELLFTLARCSTGTSIHLTLEVFPQAGCYFGYHFISLINMWQVFI